MAHIEPAWEQKLRAMPLESAAQAAAYFAEFQQWRNETASFGCGVHSVKRKPACVRAVDLFRKAVAAEEIAGLCYWQMPYEAARQRFPSIPLSKWHGERVKRGLAA